MKNFRTKGENLIFINNKGIKTPDSYIITAAEFKKKKNIILKNIKFKFKNKKIAVRSSSFNEDTKYTSNAGKYKSILNVNTKNLFKVERCITDVLSSYNNNNNNNQVLIQNMVEDVRISGVCTTIDIHNYLPNFNINYHIGSNTAVVTGGYKNTSSYIISDTKYVKSNHKFFRLTKIINKLIKIFKSNYLDIEFAINRKKEVIILQVREIIIPKNQKILKKKDYLNDLQRLEKKIIKLQKNNLGELYGKNNIFGIMPDWNPAEIIGIKPRPLAISVYKELITDHVWALNRSQFGFKKVHSNHLLTSFFGTPFIDLRTDFNSWIPNDLSDKISNKLVNYYLSKLSKNRNSHDKIEFDILFTCYTPITSKKIDLELKNNFNKDEIKKIKQSLLKITNNAFEQYEIDLKKLNLLKKKHVQISRSKLDPISKIYHLIEDCKSHGSIAFAGLARCGFIAIEILNSLVKEKILTENEKNKFLNSIKTIATQMNLDLRKLSKKKFCDKYGHLRPKTYDITTINYREGYNIYFNNKSSFKFKNIKFNFSKKQNKYLKNFLKKNKFKVKVEYLIQFLNNALVNREYGKFVFTKSIDLIFENLIKFGKKYNLNRNELSYLNIQSIINFYDELNSTTIIRNLKNEIKLNKITFEKNSKIHLPETIINKNDIYLFEKNLNSGNFITQKVIKGKTFHLEKLSNLKKIDNKILLIENADPGYDFVFSKKIKGLITKYGGQNSHMSIRCAELSIPAAIGVGNENFNLFVKNNFLTLDCLNKKIY